MGASSYSLAIVHASSSQLALLILPRDDATADATAEHSICKVTCRNGERRFQEYSLLLFRTVWELPFKKDVSWAQRRMSFFRSRQGGLKYGLQGQLLPVGFVMLK